MQDVGNHRVGPSKNKREYIIVQNADFQVVKYGLDS